MLRRSFPVRRDTYHSAVDFGAMIGARMAGIEWHPPPSTDIPPGSAGLLSPPQAPDGGIGAEATTRQIASLGILAIGGIGATYLFLKGSALLGAVALGATLGIGAMVEGGSA